MNFAIILAAGKGKRYGEQKQFVLVNNRPIIFYSMDKFNKSPIVDKIIVVTTKNRIDYVNKLVKKYNFQKVVNVITGGKERQDSVSKALKILPDNGYVAIHDSARPLFCTKMVATGFSLVKKYKASIPILPVQDTIKSIKNNTVEKTLDRSQVYYVQTPQFFKISLFKKAYLKANKENYIATDDAQLIERLEHKVHTFQGHKQNIKITDQQDLQLIKALL